MMAAGQQIINKRIKIPTENFFFGLLLTEEEVLEFSLGLLTVEFKVLLKPDKIDGDLTGAT